MQLALTKPLGTCWLQASRKFGLCLKAKKVTNAKKSTTPNPIPFSIKAPRSLKNSLTTATHLPIIVQGSLATVRFILFIHLGLNSDLAPGFFCWSFFLLFSHSLGQKHPLLAHLCKPFVFCKNKYSSPLDKLQVNTFSSNHHKRLNRNIYFLTPNSFGFKTGLAPGFWTGHLIYCSLYSIGQKHPLLSRRCQRFLFLKINIHPVSNSLKICIVRFGPKKSQGENMPFSIFR